MFARPKLKHQPPASEVPSTLELSELGAWLNQFEAKQPHVIDYFIEYVQREGAAKAPDAVIEKLNETLSTLKEVTAKSVIEEEDVNTIHSATAAVLTML